MGGFKAVFPSAGRPLEVCISLHMVISLKFSLNNNAIGTMGATDSLCEL